MSQMKNMLVAYDLDPVKEQNRDAKTYIVHNPAFVIFQSGNEEVIPKRCAISLVIQQSYGCILPIFYIFTNHFYSLQISIRSLKKSAVPIQRLFLGVSHHAINFGLA